MQVLTSSKIISWGSKLDGLLDFTPEQLRGMSFSQLADLREKYKNSPAIQSQLAPFEHRQFAQGLTQEDPLNALALSVATPAYFVAKSPILYDISKRMGLIGENATPSDAAQVNEAFKGIGQGLLNADWRNTGSTLIGRMRSLF